MISCGSPDNNSRAELACLCALNYVPKMYRCSGVERVRSVPLTEEDHFAGCQNTTVTAQVSGAPSPHVYTKKAGNVFRGGYSRG